MTHDNLPVYWWHLLLLCGTLIAVCLVDRCWYTFYPDGSYTWRNPFTWETVTYLKDGTIIIRVDWEGNVHKSEYCDPDDGNVKKVV